MKLKRFNENINMNDFDEEETDYTLDDIQVGNTYVETVYTWNVWFGGYDLKYKMVKDKEGYDHFYLDNEDDLADHDLMVFLEENEEEIGEILWNNR